MQAHWKLHRAWGLANLMIVHRLSDLDAVGDLGSQARGLAQGLLADTATRILYNEPYDEAQTAGKLLGLSSVEIGQLPELAQGEGLWRVNERAFVVAPPPHPCRACPVRNIAKDVGHSRSQGCQCTINLIITAPAATTRFEAVRRQGSSIFSVSPLQCLGVAGSKDREGLRAVPLTDSAGRSPGRCRWAIALRCCWRQRRVVPP